MLDTFHMNMEDPTSRRDPPRGRAAGPFPGQREPSRLRRLRPCRLAGVARALPRSAIAGRSRWSRSGATTSGPACRWRNGARPMKSEDASCGQHRLSARGARLRREDAHDRADRLDRLRHARQRDAAAAGSRASTCASRRSATQRGPAWPHRRPLRRAGDDARTGARCSRRRHRRRRRSRRDRRRIARRRRLAALARACRSSSRSRRRHGRGGGASLAAAAGRQRSGRRRLHEALLDRQPHRGSTSTAAANSARAASFLGQYMTAPTYFVGGSRLHGVLPASLRALLRPRAASDGAGGLEVGVRGGTSSRPASCCCTSTSASRAAVGTLVMGTHQSRGTPMEWWQVMGDHRRVEVRNVHEVRYYRAPPFKVGGARRDASSTARTRWSGSPTTPSRPTRTTRAITRCSALADHAGRAGSCGQILERVGDDRVPGRFVGVVAQRQLREQHRGDD
jgi:hypothetical protein